MQVVLDANMLLRIAKKSDPKHQIAKSAISQLEAQGAELFTVPQSVYEFWVVATRPAGAPSNGLGLTTEDAADVLERLLPRFPVLNDLPSLYDEWRSLVQRYDVKGKPAHDARMAAALIGHRATHLLTFNARDFQRGVDLVGAEFTVLEPDAVVAS